MAVVSRSIPTLLRGVSQSSDATKQSDHADIQDNADSNPVLGLTKRSGFQYLTTLSNSNLGNVHIQTINRDINEKYVAIFSNGDIKIYELDGTELTVNKPDGTTYLNTSDPRSVMKTVTIADFTFVVNTSITTRMDTTQTSLASSDITQAIVFVNQVSDNTVYSVTVDGVTVTDDTTNDSTLSTTQVATDLKLGLEAGLTGFTIAQNGPVLHIKKTDGSNFAIDGTDTQGDSHLTVVKNSIQRFTDLPRVSPHGYVVEVKGDETTNFDNYYVKFVGNNTTTDGILEEGQWEECTKPGIEFKFNYDTMPHVLVRQADGEFRFARVDGDNYGTTLQDSATFTSTTVNNTVTITKTNHGFVTGQLINVESSNLTNGQFIITKVDNNTFTYKSASNEGSHTNVACTVGLAFTLPKWGERTVGDLDSAPNPSFIDNKINNVFFFRNRLGFLADDNVVLSRVSEFFNFFPETVLSVIDSDPIDVAASHTKVAILKNAVTMGKQLILFSDQTQFVLTSSSDSLTPKTANVVVTTEFESSDQAQPVGSGSSIYFLTDKGSFAGVREYIVESDTAIKDASNITIHVPKLIPNNIFKMAVSNNQDVLVLLGTGNPNKLFINRWLYGNNLQKILNSWFTFTINPNRQILNIDFIGTDLFAVIQEGNSLTLEKIPFESDFKEANSEFEFNLDHKVTETTLIKFATYIQQSGSTTVTVQSTNHGLLTNDLIAFDFTSGDAVDGTFRITKIDNDSFSFTAEAAASSTTSGNVSLNMTAYDSTNNVTEFTLPYKLRSKMTVVGRYLANGETSTFIDANGVQKDLKAGQVIQTTNLTDGTTSTITADGDFRNSKFIIGEPYEMHYRFSKQRLTESGGNNATEVIGGRLQLHHFYIKFEDTGFFKVEVTPENRDTSIHKFTGNLLGAASSTIGAINLETGTFKVPIMSRADRVNIDIKNNTFLPTKLSSAEYEAMFHIRSRRV